MACTEEEFTEILSGEVYIDMDKLVAISKHGIPERIHSKQDARGKVDLQSVETRNKIENIIISFINYNNESEYKFGMLAILGPFICTLQSEPDIFYCFVSMMKKIEENLTQDSLTSKLSRFMIFNHFEEEEINSNDWAMSWLQYLLSVELPLECVLRLWDTYLSAQLGLDLHVYVCLAILINFSEELLELEHSEIRGFLQHLPGIDMDQIIAQAYNIRDDIRANNEL
eukprot:gene1484-1722_t